MMIAGRDESDAGIIHTIVAMIHLFGPIDEVYAKSLRRTVRYDADGADELADVGIDHEVGRRYFGSTSGTTY